jgi:hypothetical protein
MAHNRGTPRLLAKCGSAVEVLDMQQIEDPALARVKRARTTGHTDSLPTMAPHSSRHYAVNQSAGRRKSGTDTGPGAGGRMFDPYRVQSGTVSEYGSSVRRLRAGRHLGGYGGTAPPDAVRCLRPGGI